MSPQAARICGRLFCAQNSAHFDEIDASGSEVLTNFRLFTNDTDAIFQIAASKERALPTVRFPFGCRNIKYVVKC